MAWPFDALLRTYAALMPVPSSDLNAFQNRIVDAHRRVEIPMLMAYSWDSAGNNAWLPFNAIAADYEYGWECITANAPLVVPVDGLRMDGTGAAIYSFGAKVQSAGVSTLTMAVYEVTTQMGFAAVAPTIGAAISTDAAAGGAGAWDVLTVLPGAPYYLDSGKRLVLVFDNATAGDRVAAIEAVVEPITPTP